jgi:hypothetical protein
MFMQYNKAYRRLNSKLRTNEKMAINLSHDTALERQTQFVSRS